MSFSFNILGVADGQTVRMSVNDNELFITFKVDPSKYFRREGANVFTDAEISISQAVLGGTIRIEGIYEDHTIFVIIQCFIVFAPSNRALACARDLRFKYFHFRYI